MGDVPSALYALVAMLALIGFGALQLRKPALVHVAVEGSDVVVRLSRWDGIWAMKRSVAVPLERLADISVADAVDVPRRGMRMPGTALPGVIRSGTYGSGEQREFWDVRRAARLLVLDVQPPVPYARVVLEVSEPERVADDLRAARRSVRPPTP